MFTRTGDKAHYSTRMDGCKKMFLVLKSSCRLRQIQEGERSNCNKLEKERPSEDGRRIHFFLGQYWVHSLSVQEAQRRAALVRSQNRSGCIRTDTSQITQARVATAARLRP